MSDFGKTAMSGLNAANAHLQTTANNLANASTFGYKRQSAQFSAMFTSGNNAMGIGVKTDDITTDFTTGTMNTTGDELHHAIVGDGFFIVKSPDGGQKLTRVGLFEFAPDNYLVDANGNRVQGYLEDGSAGVTTDIYLDKSPLQPITSKEGILDINLGSDPTGTTSLTSSMSVYDSIGKEHDLQIKFSNKTTDPATGEAKWEIDATVDGKPLTLTPNTIHFDASGQIKPNEGALAGGKLDLDLSTLTPKVFGVPSLSVDLSQSTGYESDTSIRSQRLDGNPVSEFEKYQIEDDGKIVAYYKDGRANPIGQLALASVDNMDGLIPENGSYFSVTTDAGELRYGRSGMAGFGSVTPGVIEGSNVNTSAELVNLIEGQRNFQAASKVIGTSKELNQALNQAV
ncbi:TPA: flagellar hook-basal body complex protein [Vibrio vulnificus]|uniref:Flagellar hook protein FlgE n=1 Tax=Vibrio vulnificus TaxID=672 RepID=A0A8H9TFN2_VIBVL|nr:flagellar hook-basal body complex protein [Vibrio vulnificus]HAS8540938.1 flagellar hook-basal body complex protein [Vibrio vulnificus]